MASFTNSYFQSPLGQVARQGIGTVGGLGNIGALQHGMLSAVGGQQQPQQQPQQGDFIQDFLNKYQNDEAYRSRMDGLFGQSFASYVTPRFTEKFGVSAENLTFQPAMQQAVTQQIGSQKLINDPGQKDTPLPKAPSTSLSNSIGQSISQAFSKIVPPSSMSDPGFNYDTGRAYTPFQISRGMTGMGGGAGGR